MIFSGQWLRLSNGFVSRTGTCRFRIETHVHHRSDDFASVHAESSHHFVSGPGSQLWYRDPTTMGTRLITQIIRSLFARHENNNTGWQFRVSCVCRIFPSLPASVLPRVSPPSPFFSCFLLHLFFPCGCLLSLPYYVFLRLCLSM